MEEWSGLDWRRRWRRGRGRERERERERERKVIRCETGLGHFLFLHVQTSSAGFSGAITRSASQKLFFFVFLSITKIAVIPDLAPPIAVGAIKKASKRKKIKQKCHRVQRVGRSHSHLNGIDLFL